MNRHLSTDDVDRLMHEHSAPARADVARKLASAFDKGRMNARERHIAEEIFRLLARDTALRVRTVLAEHLKSSPDLPHDVALRLARDVEKVALPVLEHSGVLTDEDLIEIVDMSIGAKGIAIAKRAKVSEIVSEKLAATDDPAIVEALIGNDGAAIRERTLRKVLESFSENEGITGAMAHRARLPAQIAERLVTLVSDTVQEHLLRHHKISPDTIQHAISQGRERATIGVASYGASRDQIEKLVAQLDQAGKLTPSIILRAICMGDTPFFEAGLARRAHISLARAQAIIYQGGRRGLRGMCLAARLPTTLLPAIEAATEILRDRPPVVGCDDPDPYRQRVIEAILTRYEDSIGERNIEFLLSKIGRDGDTQRNSVFQE